MSAFSHNGTGGNRAGVVLEANGLSDARKKEIAGELGYSETVFLSPSRLADWRLEYFTPVEEVPLCGHATIAAFSLLKLRGLLSSPECTIETKAGILRIQVREDGLVFMQQNVPEYGEILSPADLAGCVRVDCIEKELPIQIVSTGLRDILLPVRSEECLTALSPDFERMAQVSREQEVIGLHAFTLTDTPCSTAVCRNFAPLYGIDEESATGTSNCALACYLYARGIRKSEYVFEQGRELRSVSRITVRLDAEGGTIRGVYAGGYGYLVETKEI